AMRHDLRDAVEAVLAGKPVPVTMTDAPGCPLPETTDKTASAMTTYHRDIVPILQRRCQACHRPGQSGPFALLSFQEAKSWAGAIREVVEEGRMPPWSADPKHGKFANDPSLTAGEKKSLLEWIDGGTPEGNPADGPPPRAFPDGWTIPAPDLIVEMPKAFTVPAEGVIEYQYFRVDPRFTEDRWVTAAEVRPGDPAVVHHCNIFLQPPGVESMEEVAELGALGSVCLTMAAQGTPPLLLKDGRGKRIPAGWRLVFVMHYQSVGSVRTDRTRLGLVFADPKDVRQEVATKLLYDPGLRLPPRAASHRVEKEWTATKDVLLLSLFPHMHLRGKSFRYERIRKDGSAETLLHVPKWDFAWQHRYELAEPRLVRAGETIRCIAVYDNSDANPHNPDPSKEVRAGQQSTDEMFNGYFDVCLADEDMTRPPTRWPLWLAVGLSASALLYLVRRRPENQSRPRMNTDRHGSEQKR
ncbi:MAG: hypothetical protein K2W96_07005, partial [Gemmataceae bacterium]|nr:hypothetical protein [Gemmataceae bacterium]